jgi:hypothetical protein
VVEGGLQELTAIHHFDMPGFRPKISAERPFLPPSGTTLPRMPPATEIRDQQPSGRVSRSVTPVEDGKSR